MSSLFFKIVTALLLLAPAASVKAESRSREVSQAPSALQSWDRYQRVSPLVMNGDFFRAVALKLDPLQRPSLDSKEVLDVLRNADPLSLHSESVELFLPFYEGYLAEGDALGVVVSLAYLSGLANPLHAVEAVQHIRLTPPFLQRGTQRQLTITLTYTIQKGMVRYCRTVVEKDPATAELLSVDFSGCPHFLDDL